MVCDNCCCCVPVESNQDFEFPYFLKKIVAFLLCHAYILIQSLCILMSFRFPSCPMSDIPSFALYRPSKTSYVKAIPFHKVPMWICPRGTMRPSKLLLLKNQYLLLKKSMLRLLSLVFILRHFFKTI